MALLGKKLTSGRVPENKKSNFESKTNKLIQNFKLNYQKICQDLDKPPKNPETTFNFPTKYSDLIDKSIKKIAVICADFHNVRRLPALIATGGYGRAELAPFSDVDMLIVTDEAVPLSVRRWIESLHAICWQSGIRLSYAVRSLPDCQAALQEDLHFMTSLLEKRHLYGDKKLSRQLSKIYDQYLHETGVGTLIAAKLTERDARHRKHGDSRALLQPNIKESKGGLRDLQNLFWLATLTGGARTARDMVRKKMLTVDEARLLGHAHMFFWRIRCHLHALAGRADDRLSFDVQPEIALRMGYDDPAPNLRAERFMRDYFRMANDTGYLTRILCTLLESRAASGGATAGSKKIALSETEGGFALLQNRLLPAAKDMFEKSPSEMVRIFRISQTSGFDIHPDALRQIREILARSPKVIQNNPDALAVLREIILDRKKSAQTLRRMNEAALMTAIIPDFANVFAHMQYDMYHVFTADEHIINAIDMLHRIENGELQREAPVSTQLFGQIHSRRALYFAMLFHDMAKGTGGAHAAKGAEIARRMCPKFGLDPAETETAAWLVEYHLLMTMTAFKRDLSDPKTVADFAAAVQSPERLKLLAILTAADVLAVGPGRWNNWKAGLLRDLYSRTQHILTGTPDMFDDAQATTMRQKSVRRLIGDKTAALRYLADRAPADFWHSFAPETLAGFISALDKNAGMKEQATVVRVLPAPAQDFTEVFVFTPDRKGLFATLAGALSAAGASIAAARIFTLPDGMALDVFQVQDLQGHAYDNAAFMQRTVKAALAGTLDITAEIAQHQKNLPRRGQNFRVVPQVILDNNASNSHTVVEVTGKDRPGFLYAITSGLSALGLQISAAKITTFGSRAMDVFYVKDSFGLKVVHAEKLTRIETTLKNILDKTT
jgi:[protein-PII] uridylyltransferase